MYFHLFQMGCNITTYLNLKGVFLCIIAFPPHIQMCPDQPRCDFLSPDCVSGLWMARIITTHRRFNSSPHCHVAVSQHHPNSVGRWINHERT